jgi:hypothetical protein
VLHRGSEGLDDGTRIKPPVAIGEEAAEFTAEGAQQIPRLRIAIRENGVQIMREQFTAPGSRGVLQAVDEFQREIAGVGHLDECVAMKPLVQSLRSRSAIWVGNGDCGSSGVGLKMEGRSASEAISRLILHYMIDHCSGSFSSFGDQRLQLMMRGGLRFHGQKHEELSLVVNRKWKSQPEMRLAVYGNKWKVVAPIIASEHKINVL